MVMEAAVLEKPGLNMAVGLRTYLEITGISAPPEAEGGDWVYVGVQVTNNHTAAIYVTVTGTFDGIDTYPLGGAAAWVSPGEYMWWPLHFTMPDRSVSGEVRAYYWGTDEAWHLDDSATISIPLKEVPPVVGWMPLDSATLMVSRVVPPVVGWTPLASRTIGVASVAPPVVGWQPLASTTIGVSAAAPPVTGWQPLGTPVTVNVAAGPIAPRWELIEHRDYLWGYFYDGYCEIATAEFKLTPEQMPWTNWLAEKIGERLANEYEEEVRKYGGRMLGIDFYQDTTPIMYTNFRIVAKAGFPGKGTIGWYIPWHIVIPLIISAIIGIIVYLTVCRVTEGTHKHLMELEEYKARSSRDTLTSFLIDQDYSAEALEGKTDAELRDMVDELAPPPAEGWPWYMWLGIAGLGIGGSLVAVTALRAFAPKKK